MSALIRTCEISFHEDFVLIDGKKFTNRVEFSKRVDDLFLYGLKCILGDFVIIRKFKISDRPVKQGRE